MRQLIARRFEQPEVREPGGTGTLEVAVIGGVGAAHTTLRPGWRWSEHVRAMWRSR